MKKIGRVVEVFLPNDNIDSKNIGFKIMLDNNICEFIVEQNEFNANVMRDDLVTVNEQIISNKKYIDIEVFEDE